MPPTTPKSTLFLLLRSMRARAVWAPLGGLFRGVPVPHLFLHFSNSRKFAKKIEFCLDSAIEFVYTAVTATLLAVPEKEKAPVAQLDRASDYGSEGLRFESSRAWFS